MAWFILARAVFVTAVAYSAYQAHPFTEGGLVPNVLFGVVLAVLFVLLEMRLRTAPVTHVLGALIGGAIGLGAAKVLGDALYWANLGDDRVVFLHSLILLALPYLGLVMGARKGEWLEPSNLISVFLYWTSASPDGCTLPSSSSAMC